MLTADSLFKNAIVFAQATKPSDEVMQLFRQLGLVVYYNSNPKKGFIVGNVPGATAVIRGREDTEYGKAIFIPLTPDIAIGYLLKPRTVEVVHVDTIQVRRMNEATAARSSTIAGTSSTLLTSHVRSVNYTGPIPIEVDGKGNGL